MGAKGLVGREHELEAIRAVLRADGPRAALLTGPAGIGKTRLLGEVAGWAAGSGWHVESVVATPAAAAFSLAPFAYLESDDVPPALDPSARIARTTLALRDRAGDRPLVLAVDDVPLLDAASLTLIHQLVLRGHATPIMTARDEQPLPEPVAVLVKDGTAATVELAPLAADQSAELVALTVGGTVEPQVSDAIWDLARGNPMFTREVTLDGQARGALHLAPGGAWQLVGTIGASPQLRDQIRRRLEHLDARARDLAEVLAVAETLPLAAVEHIATLDTLADLEHAGMARTDSPDEPVVRLAHPLYTDAVVTTTPAARLRIARRAAADALERVDCRRPHSVLLRARLRLDSGEPDPDLFAAAATVALERHDASQALRFAAANHEIDRSPAAGLLHARALSAAGRDGEAERAFESLVDDRLGPEWLAQITLHHADHLLMRSSDAVGAIDLLRRRIDLLPAVYDGRLRASLSATLHYAGELDESMEISLPLLAAGRGAGFAWGGVGLAWAVTGRAEAAAEACAQAHASLRAQDIPEGITMFELASSFQARQLALWQLGRSVEADDPFAPIAGVEGVPHVDTPEYQLGMRAPQQFVRGHLDESSLLYDQVAERLWAVAVPVGAHNTSLRATVEAMRGDQAKAVACLADVDAVPFEARAGFLWWTERARVWILVAQGDLEGAVELTLGLCERHAAELFHLTTSLHDLVRLGRPDLAIEGLEAQAARDGATWWDRVTCDHARAGVGGDPEVLVAVAERFEVGGLDLHAAETLAQATRRFTATGDRLRAVAVSAQLTAVLERVGRARTPSLARCPELLTERELAVARLAASGRTNREIAHRLGTSPRTVGNQLQSVYTKLDVHHRDELAPLLEP